MNEDLHLRLDKFEIKLDKIADAVATIAVQNQRLVTLEKDTAILHTRIDSSSEHISSIEQFQASCPRNSNQNQLKAIWVFVCGIVLSILGIFIKGQ
jgi:hypothetical protein